MPRGKRRAIGPRSPARPGICVYWTVRPSSAIVIPDPPDNSLIRFGHTVTIAREDDRRQIFRIVGEDEADPRQGDDLPRRAVEFRRGAEYLCVVERVEEHQHTRDA